MPRAVSVVTSCRLISQERGEDDGIEVRVVGPGAVPGLQQRDALVQVVDHLRVVVEEHALDGARGLERELVGVAVDVHERVAAPVGRRLARQARVVRAALQVAVEPVGRLVAAVRVGHRVDEDDHVLADAADARIVRHGQPIGQLHQHLRAARLVRVQGAVEEIEGTRAGDDGFRLRGIRSSRVGQGGGGGLEPGQVADAGLVRDHRQQDVAALLGAADRLHADARRGAGERTVVGVDAGAARELSGRAGDVPQEIGRGRHRGRFRDGCDPRAEEPRVGRESGDGFAASGLGRVRRGRGRQEQDKQRGTAQGHPILRSADVTPPECREPTRWGCGMISACRSALHDRPPRRRSDGWRLGLGRTATAGTLCPPGAAGAKGAIPTRRSGPAFAVRRRGRRAPGGAGGGGGHTGTDREPRGMVAECRPRAVALEPADRRASGR